MRRLSLQPESLQVDTFDPAPFPQSPSFDMGGTFFFGIPSCNMQECTVMDCPPPPPAPTTNSKDLPMLPPVVVISGQ